MKKSLYTLLFLFGCYFCKALQSHDYGRKESSPDSKIRYEKIAAVQSDEELNLQLGKLFESNASIFVPKKFIQMKKNILDKKVFSVLRIKSPYGIYGGNCENESCLNS